MTFFRDSQIETYQKMWRYMESKEPAVFVPSYKEGVERVLEGNYAFLCESSMLDWLVQRDCNLTQIGGLVDNKGYGIATPKGSRWRDKISQAILLLQEKSAIQMLYNKWWSKDGTHNEFCPKHISDLSKASALNLVNIGGVFVVLLCGLVVALFVSINSLLVGFFQTFLKPSGCCIRIDFLQEKQQTELEDNLFKHHRNAEKLFKFREKQRNEEQLRLV